MGALCTSSRNSSDQLNLDHSSLEGPSALEYMGSFWKGTWKYRARNVDHFFHIVKRGDEYVYKEVIGNHEVRAPAILDVRGNITIHSKAHNFQILLERHSTSARFRGAGNSWGKPIRVHRCDSTTELPIQATRSKLNSIGSMKSYSRPWRPTSSLSPHKTSRMNNTSMISNDSRLTAIQSGSVSCSSTDSHLSVPSNRLHSSNRVVHKTHRSSSNDSNAI